MTMRPWYDWFSTWGAVLADYDQVLPSASRRFFCNHLAIGTLSSLANDCSGKNWALTFALGVVAAGRTSRVLSVVDAFTP
jgi:hypothetical protein